MRTLEMPQRPDAVLITDTDGTELFSGSLGTTIMKSLISTSDAAIVAAGIDIWENEGGATGGLSMDHVYGRRVEADKDDLRRRKERARMKPPTGDVLDRVGKDGDDTT